MLYMIPTSECLSFCTYEFFTTKNKSEKYWFKNIQPFYYVIKNLIFTYKVPFPVTRESLLLSTFDSAD